MKWFTGFLLLSLAVLSIGLLDSSSAKAVSIYDDHYQPTSSLMVTAPLAECNDTDLTTNWSSYIVDESKWNGADLTALRTSFLSALEDEVNGSWGVSEITKPDGAKGVAIFWSQSIDARLLWHADSIEYQAASGRSIQLYCKKYSAGFGNGEPFLGVSQTIPLTQISNVAGTIKNLFVYGADLNLPSGYEGELIPDTFEPFADKLYYKITDRVGTFTPKDIDTERIIKCTIFIDDNPALEHDDAVNESMYEIPDCMSTVTHQWEAYGTYYVRLELEHAKGVRQYTHSFNVDGTTYEGVMNPEGAEEADAIDYEDCSIYGVDIINGFACVMRNFGKFLGGLIRDLFVPTITQFNNHFNQLKDYMVNKLGFLSYPFVFISTQLNAILSAISVSGEIHCTPGSTLPACVGLCAPNLLSNQSVCIRMGALEERFPQLWTTIIWFVRLAVIVALIDLMRRKYMGIVRS